MIPLLFPANPTSTPPYRQGFSHAVIANGLEVHVAGLKKTIVFFSPDTIHVNANLGASYANHPSLSVTARPRPLKLSIHNAAGLLTIASSALRVSVDKKTGALTFMRPDGSLLTRESTARPTELTEKTISGARTYDVRQTFALSSGESLYGLGQYNRPHMDLRGQELLMVQTNIGIVVPFLVSTKRYGILWDAYSKSTFKDDENGAAFWAESAPAGVDYYFVAGQNMDGVIAGYRKLTGAAPMFPKAAFGLFMSKERYKTQEQVLDVTRKFREARFPLDYIVQDWQYWGTDHDGLWSGMTWNKERYPDPAAMTRTLHNDLHTKLMISIWPSIGNDTELAHELDAKGLRFEPLHWISKQARVYDAFSSEGRAIYFKHIKKGLLDVGVDALWMDGTEVEVGGACHDAGEVERDIKGLGRNAMGDFTRYLNPYSLVTTQGTYEGQRATSEKRVLTLTRSAWAGQQRYSALPWSGDTTASWNTFRAQIAGGIDVAMAGLPYWTQDTGGFFVNSFPGGQNNPEYRELFARWNQFAIFNPVYRIHGTSIDREPYLFKAIDPGMYRSLLDAATLRYRMLPYLYSLGWKTTAEGYTMMRGLAMDFPDDRNIRKTDDAFMFGPSFLVHPVTRAMFNTAAAPSATIPTEALRTPEGKPGLEVQYFEGRKFERPMGEVIDAKVDHTWPGPPLANPPGGLRSLDDFSARWHGALVAPEDGEYEIGVEGDDGFRLWLDGKLVVEDWGEAAKRYKGAKITLQKGQRVVLRIDYYQGQRDRSLRLAWQTPSDRRAAASRQSAVDDTMATYLPAGANWFDFWTNQRLPGGQTTKRACPLGEFPLYVRAGTILPLGPAVQYATEKPDAPYEIRVYPGKDARFDIYEDDNETYRYEKGQRALIPLRWDERKGILTIGARVGSFPGMTKRRTFRVVWMAPGHGAGISPAAKADGEVVYDGRAVTVAR
jgi:alpha-D-xyloside xylohydrolase